MGKGVHMNFLNKFWRGDLGAPGWFDVEWPNYTLVTGWFKVEYVTNSIYRKPTSSLDCPSPFLYRPIVQQHRLVQIILICSNPFVYNHTGGSNWKCYQHVQHTNRPIFSSVLSQTIRWVYSIQTGLYRSGSCAQNVKVQ